MYNVQMYEAVTGGYKLHFLVSLEAPVKTKLKKQNSDTKHVTTLQY